MFFKAHNEGRIGYKKLSDADLGRSLTSHQTHIGLFDDIFTFLPDRDADISCMFVYNNNSNIIDCFFDRIKNPDGSFRSPKIKVGGRNTISVVSRIRDLAKEAGNHLEWTLIWFGLESEELVFYLCNNTDINYARISSLIADTIRSDSGRIKREDKNFDELVLLIENIVNKSSTEIIREIESVSQLGTPNKFKILDIQRAQKEFTRIGILGENIVNEYLKKQLKNNCITHFQWVNQYGETGEPYDFIIQNNMQHMIYMDVKSTLGEFDNPIFMSNQEIDFAVKQHHYQIYRTYNLENPEGSRILKISSDIKTHLERIHSEFGIFNGKCNKLHANVYSKFGILPTIDEFTFSNEIII